MAAKQARSAGLESAQPPRRRRSGGYASLIWAGIGLAVSIYLTIEHYSGSTSLACPESATINCAKVTTSQWSHVFGAPVAVLGLAYYVVMVALCSPPAWWSAKLDRVRIAAAGIGVVSVVYLIWVELFRVDAICVWCSVVHIATIGLLAAVLWRTSVLSVLPGPALPAS